MEGLDGAIPLLGDLLARFLDGFGHVDGRAGDDLPPLQILVRQTTTPSSS